MRNYEGLRKIAAEVGFEQIAPLKVDTIVLHQEVRDMCASGNCSRYGHSWSCPPYMGSLEECRQKISAYCEGILVQTLQTLEDEFDGEGMMAAERLHKKRIYDLNDKLSAEYPKHLTLGAGTCTICAECTCPDSPCRFPNQMISSMEAYGILVMEVCRENHMCYYYGSNQIAYTSCVLIDA